MARPSKRALDAALKLVRAWGAEGGKVGGKKRMGALTPDERRKLAKKAAAARWSRRKSQS